MTITAPQPIYLLSYKCAKAPHIVDAITIGMTMDFPANRVYTIKGMITQSSGYVTLIIFFIYFSFYMGTRIMGRTLYSHR